MAQDKAKRKLYMIYWMVPFSDTKWPPNMPNFELSFLSLERVKLESSNLPVVHR